MKKIEEIGKIVVSNVNIKSLEKQLDSLIEVQSRLSEDLIAVQGSGDKTLIEEEGQYLAEQTKHIEGLIKLLNSMLDQVYNNR